MTGPGEPHQAQNLTDPAEIRKLVELRRATEKRALELLEPAGKEDANIVAPHDFVMGCAGYEELGDGLLFASVHRDRFVFAKKHQAWYERTAARWQRDHMEKALAAVEDVAQRYAEAVNVLGQQLSEAMMDTTEAGQSNQAAIRNRISQLVKRIKNLRRDRGRSACLKFAHSNPELPLAISGDEFDQKPWLLSCANGVINLRTGVLEHGRQEDYLLKGCNTHYDPRADSSEWEAFLHSVYDGDEALISYLRRLFGFGLVGSREMEQVFPVLHGSGSNGKSVLVDALLNTLGDFAAPIPSEMLLDQGRSGNPDAPSPGIMALKGLRFAFASETDDGRRFSASRVKWLTGGTDKLTGRNPHDREPTTFQQSHLLVLLTNHRPGGPDGDRGFWRRCVVIPHKVRFVPGEPERPNERKRDNTIAERLRACAPGILAWLVRGCLEWQQIGLAPPESILEATGDYQDEEGTISRFIESATDEGDGLRETAGNLYSAYCIWFAENVNKNPKAVPSQKRFGASLQALERFERKKSGGIYTYTGLTLTAEYENRINQT